LQRGGTCFQSFAEDGKRYAAVELQRLGGSRGLQFDFISDFKRNTSIHGRLQRHIFFGHVLPLRPSAGHQGFYMLIPGVLPDISALIPEIVAGNPELSSTSQQVPIFFMV